MAPNGQGRARPEVPPCPRQPPPRAAPSHACAPVCQRRPRATPRGNDPRPHRRATHPGSPFPAAPTACGHRQAVRRPGRPAQAPAPGRYGQASWKVQQRRRQHRQPWLFARKPTGRGRERRRRVPSRPRRGGSRAVPHGERRYHEWAEAVELGLRMRDGGEHPCAEQWVCPSSSICCEPCLRHSFIHSLPACWG